MKDYLVACGQAIKEVWNESSRADKAGLVMNVLLVVLLTLNLLAELGS